MATATKRPATKRPVTTIKWDNLSDFDESKNLLIVGDSGAGKTVLAGGAPKLLFLALENGTISAKRQGSKAKMRRINTWDELETALDDLDKIIADGTNPFEWVCLDSLPKMQQMLRQHLLNIGLKEGRKGADLDALQLQDYNKWYGMFQRFVDRMIEMPINVIFTSTSMRIEAEDDDGVPQDLVLPAIEGKAKEGYKLAQNVCAAMSSVWFLNIEGKGDRRKRVLYTQRRPPYFAKCRYSVLPARVVLAPNDITTMARLIAKIDTGDVLEEVDNSDLPDLKMGDEEEEETTEEVEEETDEEELDDEEEPEPEPEPAPKRSRVRRPAAKKPEPVEVEDDDDLELEDDEEEPEPPKPAPRRRRPGATGAKPAPARTATRRTKPAPVEDEDDLDLEEDLDDKEDGY